MDLPRVLFNISATSPSLPISPLDFPDWIDSMLNQSISYLYILLGIPGCIGNILNILVYAKMGFSETINISFFTMAITDLLSLLLGLWDAICYLPYFYSYKGLPFVAKEMALYTGGWTNELVVSCTAVLTAFVSLERCLCVVFPLKVKTIMTRRRTILAILLFVLITLVLPSLRYMFVQSKLVFDLQTNHTILRLMKQQAHSAAWLYTGIRVYVGFIVFMVPLFSVMACSVFLTYSLKKSSKWREQAASAVKNKQTSKQGNSKKRTREIRTIKMVLTTAIVFIICTLPFFVRKIVTAIFPDFTMTRKTKYTKLFRLMTRFGKLMFGVNSSANFLIFFIIGTNFRRVLKQMFGITVKTVQDNTSVMKPDKQANTKM